MKLEEAYGRTVRGELSQAEADGSVFVPFAGALDDTVRYKRRLLQLPAGVALPPDIARNSLDLISPQGAAPNPVVLRTTATPISVCNQEYLSKSLFKLGNRNFDRMRKLSRLAWP